MGNRAIVGRYNTRRRKSEYGAGQDTRLPYQTQRQLEAVLSQVWEMNRLMTSLQQLSRALEIEWPSLGEAIDISYDLWGHMADVVNQNSLGLYNVDELDAAWIYLRNEDREMVRKSRAWKDKRRAFGTNKRFMRGAK